MLTTVDIVLSAHMPLPNCTITGMAATYITVCTAIAANAVQRNAHIWFGSTAVYCCSSLIHGFLLTSDRTVMTSHIAVASWGSPCWDMKLSQASRKG